VVETPIGNIGSLCCWEHLQPLSKYAMYSQNEQIHCGAWPSFSLYRGAAYALGHEVNNAASQVYAVEGGCFVIAPCATVSKAMSDLMCTDAGKQQMLGTGGGHARIYAPDGSPLGTPLAQDEEGLLIADIDLGMISLAKAAADPSGHYSRPDVTQLLLNKTRREPVVVQLTPEPEGSAAEPVVA
jgi:aliphatic nitrilase